MNEKGYVDGLYYELRNSEFDNDGRMLFSDVYVQSIDSNSYSESSERMMNRVCHRLDVGLTPDYNPINEHWGTAEDGTQYVRELVFRVVRKD